MRVARELHDAVAHNISVIAIQAGGAVGIAERDPERAAEIAELIASVAREALAELGRLADLPTAGTAPGLARRRPARRPARAAGLEVELEVDDRARTLPAGVDLAAFRIVQEALANTAKHANAGHALGHGARPGPRGRAGDRRRRARPERWTTGARRRPRAGRDARAGRALRRLARPRTGTRAAASCVKARLPLEGA